MHIIAQMFTCEDEYGHIPNMILKFKRKLLYIFIFMYKYTIHNEKYCVENNLISTTLLHSFFYSLTALIFKLFILFIIFI